MKDQALERFVHEESFEENNNLSQPEPDFQVLDSETSDTHENEVVDENKEDNLVEYKNFILF